MNRPRAFRLLALSFVALGAGLALPNPAISASPRLGPVVPELDRRGVAFPLAVPGAHASQSEIEARVRQFALSWGEPGSPEVLARHLSVAGVRLGLDGVPRAPVPARQASIALRDYRRGFESAEVEIVRAAPVAGTPGRGFAELRWTLRTSGSGPVLTRSAYVGLVLEDGVWRIDEIRILP